MYESVLLDFSITNFSQNTQELQLIIFNERKYFIICKTFRNIKGVNYLQASKRAVLYISIFK